MTLGVLGLLLLLASPAVADDAAWDKLTAVREALSAAKMKAEFVQTYVPAGFSTGDEERGRLYVGLPDCLRWDYEEPYPRRYLLCGQTVWVWSPDEEVGDRYLGVSREETGLDFLMLSVERLRQKYEASLTPDGTVALAGLDNNAAFTIAEIEADPATGRPVRLAYTDLEGNETAFVLSLYSDLEDREAFLPPAGIEWVDTD